MVKHKSKPTSPPKNIFREKGDKIWYAKLKNNPFDNNQDPRVRNNAANTNSQNLSVKKDEVAKPSESVTKPYSEIKHELETKQHQKTVKIDVAGKTYMIENADRMGVDQLENKLAEHLSTIEIETIKHLLFPNRATLFIRLKFDYLHTS